MVWVTAFYTEDFAPKTGLSPTIDIYRLSDDVQVVTGSAMSEVGGGYYKYDFSTYDEDEEYVMVADGTATLDNVERYKYGSSEDADNKEIFLNIETIEDNIIAVIESQRGAHTGGYGQILYVDPVNGATYASGARGGKNDPFDSIQDCHDNMVIDSNHDIVILIPGSAAGITTLDEQVTLTKRYTFYRGPGRDFLWLTTSPGNTIEVQGDGMEFSGFQLETDTVGAGHGIEIDTVDFIRVHEVWFNETRGDGINGTGCSNCQFHNNTFIGTGQGGSGQAIQIDSAATQADHNRIFLNHFGEIAGHGIYLTGANVDHTVIENNEIHDCTGWGININTVNVSNTVVRENILGNNTLGDIQDLGTDTIQINNEQWAKETTAQTILTDTNEIQLKLPTNEIMGSSDKSDKDDEIDSILGYVDTMEVDLKSYMDIKESNIRGSDSDDLKDLSDQLDVAQADLDDPDQYKADVSALALEATAQAIKLRTDNLPDDPADESNLSGLIKQLRNGNNSFEFVVGTVINATRKVGVGRLDHCILRIKDEGDADWSSPVATHTLYYWYENTGDINPIYVKEEEP